VKIRRDRGEPRLRNVVWYTYGGGIPAYKDTPKLDVNDERRLKLELAILQQPPKSVERIIVPD